MFSAEVRVTQGGVKFQMYYCDRKGCVNKFAVPVGSMSLPMNWAKIECKDSLEVLHFCNSPRCRIFRRSFNPVTTTNPVAKIKQKKVVAPIKKIKPLPAFATVGKFECFRCETRTDHPVDWSIADGNTFCNKKACRDFAQTHSNFHMLNRAERAAA